MKKSILLLAVAFFLSLPAALAQSDTTGVRAKDPTKDMVKITSTELPQPVKDALSSSSYTGWESGDIYRSENSDKYVIKVGDATQPKYYYFDRNGKPIKMKK
ncbi:MAG TPA: hypothetical protein VFW11_22725 [Cyclobacteriaceae bacterium]|nr:hypothetical protein [Cyclobacteriaceae bacterium]